MAQKYIVRADRAGVFFGEIESRTGSEVTMRNVRRIWRWEGANSISQLAVDMQILRFACARNVR